MSWWQWTLVGAAAIWATGLWLARRPGNAAVAARVARSGSRYEKAAPPLRRAGDDPVVHSSGSGPRRSGVV